MTLVHTDVYEEAQLQNPAPIWAQEEVPPGIHDIELSWDRAEGYMRIIIEGQKWWFKELLGKAVATGADSERGRLHFQGMARIDGETLTFYRPPDAEPHPLITSSDIKLVRRVPPEKGHRLCYRRMDRAWRARDDDMDWEDPEALKIVKDIVGDFVAEWRLADDIAHVYHRGWEIIDKRDILHLFDPSITPYVAT